MNKLITKPLIPSVGIKRVLIGLSLIAATAATPALAASPTITDAGSAYWTARVDGSGFTPSTFFTTNYAFVEIWNSADDSYVLEVVPTTMQFCFWLCSGGGTFSAVIDMAPHQCNGAREAWAYDYASGASTGWISLQCS